MATKQELAAQYVDVTAKLTRAVDAARELRRQARAYRLAKDAAEADAIAQQLLQTDTFDALALEAGGDRKAWNAIKLASALEPDPNANP